MNCPSHSCNEVGIFLTNADPSLAITVNFLNVETGKLRMQVDSP